MHAFHDKTWNSVLYSTGIRRLISSIHHGDSLPVPLCNIVTFLTEAAIKPPPVLKITENAPNKKNLAHYFTESYVIHW